MNHQTPFPGNLAPVLNLYNKLLSRGFTFSPFQWDPENLRFKFVTLQILKCVPYYLNIFGVCGFITLVCSMKVFLDSDTVSWEKLIFTTLIVELVIYMCITCIPFLYYWNSIRHGFDCYNNLIQGLELTNNSSFPHFSTNATWRRIAFAWRIIIYYYKLMPIVVIPGVLWLELDPTAYAINQLYLTYNISSYTVICVIWLVRALFCVNFISELLRYFVYFFITFMYSFERKIYALCMISNIPRKYDNIFGDRQLKWFRVLTVSDRVWNEPWCTIMGQLLGGGFVMMITLNFFSIACLNLLPPLIYWILPLVSVIAYFLSNALLTAAVGSTTMSCQILDLKLFQEPVADMTKFQMNWTRKVLKSSRPLACACGSFYILALDNKVAFFYDVFLRTVDLIMLGIFD